MIRLKTHIRQRAKVCIILMVSFMAALCSFAQLDVPQWWLDRGVINSHPSDDYAPVNLGQLKHIAMQAYNECIAQGFTQSAEHDALKAVLDDWLPDNENYAPANVGQVKYIGSLFHAWLASAGYTNAINFVSDGNEYAPANVGQVKNVFNIKFSGSSDPVDPDYDGDGLLDAWEWQIVNADPNDLIRSVEDVRGYDDFDGDGVSNGDEFLFGTDPTESSERPPVAGFASGETLAAEGDGQISIAVTVQPPPASNTTFIVTAAGGTAVNGADYEFEAANVTLSPSALSTNLLLTILTDEIREPVETVRLVIAGLSAGAVIGISEHYVRITDDVIDSDSDGLPDWWELKYWGDLMQDISGNDDGDDWNNLQEYRLGTDPTKGMVNDINNVLKLRVVTPLD